jgi:hypothetical protein
MRDKFDAGDRARERQRARQAGADRGELHRFAATRGSVGRDARAGGQLHLLGFDGGHGQRRRCGGGSAEGPAAQCCDDRRGYTASAVHRARTPSITAIPTRDYAVWGGKASRPNRQSPHHWDRLLSVVG